MKLKTIRVTITSCSPQPFKLPFNIPCCRFQAGAAAQDKRGLVDTYLDFCAFYRPNFFILENVQGFSTFGGGEVLRGCLGRLVSRFLSHTLHSSNFYMLPFWSPCHAISKTVFIFTLAQFLPVLVKLVKNSHFYNVNLAQNLKTVVTFYWNVRLS